MRMLERLWQFVVRIFRRQPAPVETPALPIASPPPEPPPRKHRRPRRERDVFVKPVLPPELVSAPPKPKRPRAQRTVLHIKPPEPEEPAPIKGWHFGREDVEEHGTFYFRGALLNELERYFRVIARMKRASVDAYDLYSKIGATLIPPRILIPVGELPAYWHNRETRPAFGALAHALDRKDSKNTLEPRLMYFHKLEVPPSYVEPTKDDVYEIVAYFDAERADHDKKAPKWMRKAGFCLGYHIAVDPRGRCRTLKHLQTIYQHINYRASDGERSGNPNSTNGYSGRTRLYTHHIPVKLWDYPPFLREWYKDNKDLDVVHGETFEQWSHRFLMHIASMAHVCETGVRIEVVDQQDNAATFAVDMKRMAYFFKDRDLVLTEKGTRARIFHVVRPHQRTLKSGKVLDLKMHFRGLRTFPWAGYRVHLTIPGLHHDPLFTFTAALMDREAAEKLGRAGADAVPMKRHGELLRLLLYVKTDEARELLNKPEHDERKRATG